MPLPEPDPPSKPEGDHYEGRSTMLHAFPRGGVVKWEREPGGVASLSDAIKRHADTADNTAKRSVGCVEHGESFTAQNTAALRSRGITGLKRADTDS